MIEKRHTGLRELKKARTHGLIAETAMRLFLERGFEGVTVAEIAKVAEVAEQTVFNYFPTKEDLVYWRLEGFEEELVEAVRKRAPDESVLAAFRRFVVEQRGLLGDDDPAAFERLFAISRLIATSPALLARERHVFDRYTEALATLIAAEQGASPDDLTAWAVANSLVGVHRALVGYVRRQVLAGERGPELRMQVQTRANFAFEVLQRGLDAYGIRNPGVGP